MNKTATAPVADAADGAKTNTDSTSSFIAKAVNTKKSINAYFKGEITMSELNARGIKFVGTL